MIVADRETPNRIYAATINTTTGGGFFFVSTDNGENWRPSMRSMPPRLITYSILQDSRDANTNLSGYQSWRLSFAGSRSLLGACLDR